METRVILKLHGKFRIAYSLYYAIVCYGGKGEVCKSQFMKFIRNILMLNRLRVYPAENKFKDARREERNCD
jgi:hypothetical protein